MPQVAQLRTNSVGICSKWRQANTEISDAPHVSFERRCFLMPDLRQLGGERFSPLRVSVDKGWAEGQVWLTLAGPLSERAPAFFSGHFWATPFCPEAIAAERHFLGVFRQSSL